MSQTQYKTLMSNLLKQKHSLAKLREELEGREGKLCRCCEGDQSGLQKIPQLNYSMEYVTTYLQEIPQRIR